MTPLILQLLKAVAIVAGAGIVLRKFSFKDYPAFVCWMAGEIVRQTATLGIGALPPLAIFAEDLLCAAAICEVIRECRLRVRIDIQIRAFVWAIATSKILASIPALTSLQQWYLFRSYFLWAAFAALLAAMIARWRYPILERRASVILRIGMTVWVGMLAVSGSFVKAGVGYMLFPHTMQTWSTVNMLTHCSIATVVIAMSIAMAASAPGRKRAAIWQAKGKVVVGRIEQQAA